MPLALETALHDQATLKILPYISDVPVARFKAAVASEQARDGLGRTLCCLF